jgi:hypothetical protein
MGLRPRSGFDWLRVSWGAPDEPRAEACSYCDAPLVDGGVPLVLWNADGWCAQFCDDCQRTWWGLESCDDDKDLEEPSLGPCCICQAETGARTIVMLPVKCVIPGHGWGCFVCGLPMDGASAVVCDVCAAGLESGTQELRFACSGFPGTDGRVPIETLTVPHEHDSTVEH